MLYLYWSLPFILFIAQVIFTLNSLNQIRYEELAEAVRNPFWLQNRFIYDGISSNIGWYSLLTAVYNLFGFHLFTGKIIRLILQLVSLFALGFILKKYLGTKLAIVPFITIGLSPTLLYFNTLQTSYGIDLQYLPIVLYLLISKQIMGWGIAMIAWMSYPTFFYYLPAIFYWFRPKVLKNLLFNLVAFLTPLIVGILYIKNRDLLIYDGRSGSGIFRGAGVLGFNLELFANNFKHNLVNLFSNSFGYNFELTKVEFSDFYPVLSILAIVFVVFKLWKKKKTFHLPIILMLSVLFLNILIADFSVDPTSGMRRITGIVAAIYGLFTLAWYFVNSKAQKDKRKRIGLILILLLLPLHHIIVYPINLFHLKDLSVFREPIWLSVENSPAKFLDGLIDHVQKQNLSLVCQGQKGEIFGCRYSEVFAGVAGACLWNRLECHDISGYDPKTKGFIPLSLDTWNSYYLDH